MNLKVQYAVWFRTVLWWGLHFKSPPKYRYGTVRSRTVVLAKA